MGHWGRDKCEEKFLGRPTAVAGRGGIRAQAGKGCALAVPRRTKWAKINRVSSKIKLLKSPENNNVKIIIISAVINQRHTNIYIKH